MEKIIPGQNGLPPMKDDYFDYSVDEKIAIVTKAAEFGVKKVAEAYRIKWKSLQPEKDTMQIKLSLRDRRC